MADNHKGHSHHGQDEAGKNLLIAFFLNLFFAIIEVIGGILTNSVAILSDAVHDFGDSLSLAIAWYLQKISKKESDSRYTYGYKRFSLLGSIFISLVLIVGALFILNESIKRLGNPQETHALGMVGMAILGIVVHGAAVFRLKKGKSHNERAVYLHMMEDLMGWIAVLVGGLLMHFFNLPYVDPILSLLIVVWLLYNVYRNLMETVTILLQEVPKEINFKELKKELLAIEHVDSIHHLHIWTLDGEKHILTAHLVVKDGVEPDKIMWIKGRAREIVAERGVLHTTFEVESLKESKGCYLYNNPC